MNKQIHLALGVHNHQPVGNFGWVIEEAWRLAYQPFLDVLDRHPAIKVNMHITGPLWQWLKSERPTWLRRLGHLAAQGRVEILGGAFYEPILPNIPDRDKIAQIRRHSREIQHETGSEPQGMWLAERVWEPSLAGPIHEAGIRYTLLDESHFRHAGVSSHDLFGYHITEDQGFPLLVFPISYKLRHLIPFADPEKTIEYLWENATPDGQRMAVMADDGEKFGAWPGTHDLVYQRQWLERFFTLLEQNAEWLKVSTFSEYLAEYPAVDRTYLPAASYSEMMEWAMPAHAARQFQSVVGDLQQRGEWKRYEPFMNGGFWRNFLSKYPESNNLHKKSLLVSAKVAAMQGEKLSRAQDELFAGQCNCAYWHGVFGGLYLNHLRSALYQHLITAEALADEERHGGAPFIEVRTTDFDCDSRNEILVNSDTLSVYLAPHRGGSIFELDFKPMSVNLLDILNRHEEAYHTKVDQLLKRATPMDRSGRQEHIDAVDLSRLLQYDKYRRMALVDHFLHADATLEEFSNGKQADTLDRPYTYHVEERPGSLVVTLERHEHILDGERKVPLKVEKSLRFLPGEASFSVEYRVSNESAETCNVWFGIEWNLAFPSGSDAHSFYQVEGQTLEDRLLDSSGRLESVHKVCLVDGIRKLAVELGISHAASLWRYPLETISQSEAGFERCYQGSTLLFNWKTALPPGLPFATRFELRLSHIGEPQAAEFADLAA